jgi:hypothetical protein
MLIISNQVKEYGNFLPFMRLLIKSFTEYSVFFMESRVELLPSVVVISTYLFSLVATTSNANCMM